MDCISLCITEMTKELERKRSNSVPFLNSELPDDHYFVTVSAPKSEKEIEKEERKIGDL